MKNKLKLILPILATISVLATSICSKELAIIISISIIILSFILGYIIDLITEFKDFKEKHDEIYGNPFPPVEQWKILFSQKYKSEIDLWIISAFMDLNLKKIKAEVYNYEKIRQERIDKTKPIS